MRIAICDDEPHTTDPFVDIMTNFFKTQNISCDIKMYEKSTALLDDVNNGVGDFDFYCIDIDIPVISGTDLSVVIRRAVPDAIIFFLSSHDNLGNAVCRSDSDAYIYKSMCAGKIEKELDYLMNLFCERKSSFQFKTIDGDAINLPIASIEYIESLKRDVTIHMINGKALEIANIPLKTLCEHDEFSKFIRVGRHYIINHDNITSIKLNSIILRSGLQLNFSKSQSIEFQKCHSKICFSKMKQIF